MTLQPLAAVLGRATRGAHVLLEALSPSPGLFSGGRLAAVNPKAKITRSIRTWLLGQDWNHQSFCLPRHLKQPPPNYGCAAARPAKPDLATVHPFDVLSRQTFARFWGGETTAGDHRETTSALRSACLPVLARPTEPTWYDLAPTRLNQTEL
jgi:hypothetical protein